MSATTEIPAISPATPLPPLAPVGIDESADDSGNRSFVLAWLLSLLFGFLGLDRFYTGRYSTGVLKALSLGGLGIWWIIDLVIVLAGGLRYGRAPLRGFDHSKEIAWIATGLTIIVAYSLQLDALVGSLFAGLL